MSPVFGPQMVCLVPTDTFLDHVVHIIKIHLASFSRKPFFADDQFVIGSDSWAAGLDLKTGKEDGSSKY